MEYRLSLLALVSFLFFGNHLQILKLLKSLVGSIIDHIVDYIDVEAILCLCERLDVLIVILDVILNRFLKEFANRLIGHIWLLLVGHILQPLKTVKLF